MSLRRECVVHVRVRGTCIGGGMGPGGHMPPQKLKVSNRAPPKFDIKLSLIMHR